MTYCNELMDRVVSTFINCLEMWIFYIHSEHDDVSKDLQWTLWSGCLGLVWWAEQLICSIIAGNCGTSVLLPNDDVHDCTNLLHNLLGIQRYGWCLVGTLLSIIWWDVVARRLYFSWGHGVVPTPVLCLGVMAAAHRSWILYLCLLSDISPRTKILMFPIQIRHKQISAVLSP